jgi:hypothetical protein
MNPCQVFEGLQVRLSAEPMALRTSPDVALRTMRKAVSPPLTPLDRRTFIRFQQGVSPPLTGMFSQSPLRLKAALALGSNDGPL